MSAECADVRYGWSLEPRTVVVGFAIASLLSGVVASCDNKNGSGSPIDTNGTPGGGYNPPKRYHNPKGMELPSRGIPEEAQPAVPVEFNDNAPLMPAILRMPRPEHMILIAEPDQTFRAV